MPRTKQEAMKRKKNRGRHHVRKEAPLPVFTHGTDLPTPVIYTGYLQGSSVVVQHSGDMDFLYNMGFFGKGSLSRSDPNFDSRQQKVHFPSAGGTIQTPVMSKRKYLAHLRYRALADDDEMGYNDVIQQEQALVPRFEEIDDDDEEDVEDDDEDEDEEEDDVERIDLSGFGNLQSLEGLPRSYIVAVMNQVAMLSKERIATFLRVSDSMASLESKYMGMRQKQVAFLETMSKGDNRPSASSTASKGHSGHVTSCAGKSGGTDPVVILNSDGSESEHGEEKQDVKEDADKGNSKDDSAKGWDSDGEGDADFWGMGDEDTEKGAGEHSDVKKKSDESSSNVNGFDEEKDKSAKESGLEQGEDQVKDETCEGGNFQENSSNFNSESESSSNLSKMNDEKELTEDVKLDKDLVTQTAAWQDRKTNEHNVTGVLGDNGSEVKDGDEDKKSCNELIKESVKIAGSEEVKCFIESTEITTESECGSAQKQPSTAVGGDSSDDDVICVEEESAQPAKLHQYLSQSANPDASKSGVVTKNVCFMSCVTPEPKFIEAKVGFRTWDTVLHFDYAGDHTHIPTAMKVTDDNEGQAPNASTSSSPTYNLIFERIYPPVNSLLTDPESGGSVIKQRLGPIPHLNSAVSNLKQMFKNRNWVSSNSSYSSNHTSSQSQRVPFSASSQKHFTPLSRVPNHLSQLSSAANKHSFPPVHPLSSSASVTPSQLKLYLKIFTSEKHMHESSDSGEEEEVNSSDKEGNDEMLQKLQAQLGRTGLLKQTLKSTDGDEQNSGSSKEESPLDAFHSMLSEYLTSNKIALEDELALLRIVMYDKSSLNVSTIPMDMITDMKSKLSPGQVSCFLERLDHIQNNIEGMQRKSGQEVITIELSDDEAEGKETEDIEMNNSKDHSGKESSASSRHDNVDKDEEDVETESAVGLGQDEGGDGDKLNCHKDAAGDDEKVYVSGKRQLDDIIDGSVAQSPEKKLKSHLQQNVQSNEESEQMDCEGGAKAPSVTGKESSLDNDEGAKGCINLTNDGDHQTQGDEEMCNGKSQIGEEGVGAVSMQKRDKGSVGINEEKNEIYIGSSDDEPEDIERRNSRAKKQYNVYSQEDDVNGDRFVIANTSDEDDGVMVGNESDHWPRQMNKWKPCLKKDPYPTQEKLHLMLEEAFFLTYGLGCLRILDQDMVPLNISALWQRFLVVQEKFIPHYVAYHYFRSRGWVPKSGLKFGCDFILYKEGPAFFHASYSVVVVPVKEGSLTQMYWENGELDFSQRWTSWIALAGLNRITEHVSKELMLCYVIFPKGLTEEDSKSPKCLPSFKVKEVVVSRWVSSRERESKETVEEMP